MSGPAVHYSSIESKVLRLEEDGEAQRPIWKAFPEQEPRSLPEANKELVLGTLYRAFRWRELRERIDESARGEHVVVYQPQEGEPSGARPRQLLCTAKLLPIDGEGGNLFREPFFRQGLWDAGAMFEDEGLRDALWRFTGVESRHAHRLETVLERLGSRVCEVIRFAVVPGEDTADRVFESFWRLLAMGYERGIQFYLATTDSDSLLLVLMSLMEERLGRRLYIVMARARLLNRETRIEKETALYLLDTASLSQSMKDLAADERRALLARALSLRQASLYARAS